MELVLGDFGIAPPQREADREQNMGRSELPLQSSCRGVVGKPLKSLQMVRQPPRRQLGPREQHPGLWDRSCRPTLCPAYSARRIESFRGPSLRASSIVQSQAMRLWSVSFRKPSNRRRVSRLPLRSQGSWDHVSSGAVVEGMGERAVAIRAGWSERLRQDERADAHSLGRRPERRCWRRPWRASVLRASGSVAHDIGVSHPAIVPIGEQRHPSARMADRGKSPKPRMAHAPCTMCVVLSPGSTTLYIDVVIGTSPGPKLGVVLFISSSPRPSDPEPEVLQSRRMSNVYAMYVGVIGPRARLSRIRGSVRGAAGIFKSVDHF